MKVVFFGTPSFAVPSLERLLADPQFEVVAVVTQPDKRRGRGNQQLPSPVKAIALQHQLPIWQPARIKKDEPTLQALHATQADAFVVVAYGQILSQVILDMPRLGCINAHGSLLPKYRGAAPIQWSLVNGEPETGITTMLMDAGMDTGPMLLEAKTAIALLDTCDEVATRLAALSAELLVATLQQLDQGTLTPRSQDGTQATYAPLIQKEDYHLDWTRPAIALHNQIRGFSPNCTTDFRGDGLKVLRAVPLGEAYWSALPVTYHPLAAQVSQWEAAGPPGTVVAIAKGFGPIIRTGGDFLLLQLVQLPGKRPQTGSDFANGARVAIGEILGSEAKV